MDIYEHMNLCEKEMDMHYKRDRLVRTHDQSIVEASDVPHQGPLRTGPMRRKHAPAVLDHIQRVTLKPVAFEVSDGKIHAHLIELGELLLANLFSTGVPRS